MKVYQREAEKQRILVKKSDFTQRTACCSSWRR